MLHVSLACHSAPQKEEESLLNLFPFVPWGVLGLELPLCVVQSSCTDLITTVFVPSPNILKLQCRVHTSRKQTPGTSAGGRKQRVNCCLLQIFGYVPIY